MTIDKNKLIYLKSLFSKFKSNEKLSEELKIEMAKLNLNVDAYNNKPIDPLADQRAGRKFILNNMEDFLSYAVNYSVLERMRHEFPLATME